MDTQKIEQPLISVVVPVYKVEKYLNECVDGIISQTYKNIEIILVDDGSPDSCPRICDEYAEKDGRVKVIHQKNGGLSAARNSGIEIAQGEYISFIDSDDRVQPVFIEQLYLTLESSDASISGCSFSHYENDLENNIKSDYKTYTDSEALTEILIERDLATSAWAKLFAADLFEEIRFPEGSLYEDYAVMPMLFSKAGKISHVNSKLYYYRTNTEGLTRSGFNEKHMQYFDVAQSVNDYIEKTYPELLVHAHNRDTSMAVAFYRKINRSSSSVDPKITDELIKRIRDGRGAFMKSNYPFFKKCAAVVISVCPGAAKLLLKL